MRHFYLLSFVLFVRKSVDYRWLDGCFRFGVVVYIDNVEFLEMVPIRVFLGSVCSRSCALMTRIFALVSLTFSNVCGIKINSDKLRPYGSNIKSFALAISVFTSTNICE